jgi:hypothetical protein
MVDPGRYQAATPHPFPGSPYMSPPIHQPLLHPPPPGPTRMDAPPTG